MHSHIGIESQFGADFCRVFYAQAEELGCESNLVRTEEENWLLSRYTYIYKSVSSKGLAHNVSDHGEA
jgi:hypothetical protein